MFDGCCAVPDAPVAGMLAACFPCWREVFPLIQWWRCHLPYIFVRSWCALRGDIMR